MGRQRWAAAALFAACATVLVLSTRLGIGVGPDATAYLGLRPHDEGHAPLYSWLLRLLAVPGGEAAEIARWLNVGLYAATAVLAARLVHAGTGSLPAACAAALLIAFTSQGIALYSNALSEPLFVLTLLLGFAALSGWHDRPSSRRLLLAAATAALVALARYPGVALAATGILVVAAAAPGGRSRRLLDATLFGAIALAPLVTWLLYVARTSGTAAGRSAALAGNANAATFRDGLLEASRYLLPTEFPAVVRIAALAVVLVALGAATIAFYRRGRAVSGRARAASGTALPAILVLFAAAYTGTVVLSVLIEPYLPISARYLFPLHVTAVLLGAITLPVTIRGRWPRRALVAGVCGLVALGVVRGVKTAADGFRDGHAYASRAWAASGAVGYVRSLPDSTTVYTDGYYALLFLTDRDVRQIPAKIIRRLGVANPDYATELAEMQATLASGAGMLVLFDWDTDDFELPTPAELAAALPLREHARLRDAAVYTLATTATHERNGDNDDVASSAAARD